MTVTKQALACDDARVATRKNRLGAEYAAKVGCSVRHSGSARLYAAHTGYWQCEGCGHIVRVDEVLRAQAVAS